MLKTKENIKNKHAPLSVSLPYWMHELLREYHRATGNCPSKLIFELLCQRFNDESKVNTEFTAPHELAAILKDVQKVSS